MWRGAYPEYTFPNQALKPPEAPDQRVFEAPNITLEPGLYRSGYGGCRLEDLVLVTKDGAEVLTDYPYDLEP